LITCIPAKKIDFEISHFRNFLTSMTLTLTLDRVIRHTFVYHSSTSIVEIEKKLFYERTDGH